MLILIEVGGLEDVGSEGGSETEVKLKNGCIISWNTVDFSICGKDATIIGATRGCPECIYGVCDWIDFEETRNRGHSIDFPIRSEDR